MYTCTYFSFPPSLSLFNLSASLSLSLSLSQASDNSQLKISSSECLQQLTQLIGQTIMRGRVEQYNPS